MTRVSATTTSVSAARWLVGVMASVVLSFAISTVVSGHYESAVVDRAEDIIGNAMPSVKVLSSARGDLRVLENELERLPYAPVHEQDEMRDKIRSLRQNIEQSLATYASLPSFPSELELSQHVYEDRADLERAMDAFVVAPEARTYPNVHRRIDLVDAAVERNITFDAAQGQRLGLEIQSIHARASVLGAFLDVFSVLLAIIATVLALRQLRRAARASEAERAARDLRERLLAEQNEALGHFAGRVAHDILSPLGAVQLSYDWLREAAVLQPPAQRVVERGTAAVRRVQTLVDGLLEFSRAGGHPEAGASTEVAPVITDIVADLGAQAKQHRIALEVSAVPAGSVACSAGVLTSIISNLVHNAIKYMNGTDERRIDLRIRMTGGCWRFEVQDTGPGIPLAQQQRIFEPYVQLARGSSGIGLGLATVDRLVRAHGGTVGLISPLSGGALFWFELPTGTSASESTAAVARVPQPA